MLLLRNAHGLDCLFDDSLMDFVLIVNIRVCDLDELLEFGNLEFEELHPILGGGLLNLRRSREPECGLELAGKGFEAVDDVFRNV